MEFLGPPRGAVTLLKVFASESDFDTVLGDLSEEFQQQVSAFGKAAATRWYWREALRNAGAFARRELLRTPVAVLLVTFFIYTVVSLVTSLGEQLLVSIQWAWVPPRLWHWYQYGVEQFLFPAAIVIGAGVLASYFLKGRELSLMVAFAIALSGVDLYGICALIRDSALGRLSPRTDLRHIIQLVLISWCLAIGSYSLGCLWIRWHRRSGESSEHG